MHFLTLRGVQTAAFVNVIVTIAKIVPILTFIGIAIVGFKAEACSPPTSGATTPRSTETRWAAT